MLRARLNVGDYSCHLRRNLGKDVRGLHIARVDLFQRIADQLQRFTFIGRPRQDMPVGQRIGNYVPVHIEVDVCDPGERLDRIG